MVLVESMNLFFDILVLELLACEFRQKSNYNFFLTKTLPT